MFPSGTEAGTDQDITTAAAIRASDNIRYADCDASGQQRSGHLAAG
jgi:hypothetical protein